MSWMRPKRLRVDSGACGHARSFCAVNMVHWSSLWPRARRGTNCGGLLHTTIRSLAHTPLSASARHAVVACLGRAPAMSSPVPSYPQLASHARFRQMASYSVPALPFSCDGPLERLHGHVAAGGLRDVRPRDIMDCGRSRIAHLGLLHVSLRFCRRRLLHGKALLEHVVNALLLLLQARAQHGALVLEARCIAHLRSSQRLLDGALRVFWAASNCACRTLPRGARLVDASWRQWPRCASPPRVWPCRRHPPLVALALLRTSSAAPCAPGRPTAS